MPKKRTSSQSPGTPGWKFSGFMFPNTTPIPDQLFDELLPILSGAETKVLLYICRRTFGFKKHSDNISLNQMLRGITRKDGTPLDGGVGLSKPTLVKALKGLEEKNIIIADRRESREKGYETTNYQLNLGAPPSKENEPGLVKNFTLALVKEFNLQETVLQQTEQQHARANKSNNNSSGEPDDSKHDVVVALSNLGISETVAKRLASRYNHDRIFEKIGYLAFLQESDPERVANPRGWLRRAIEENFGPPDGYKSREEQEREAAEKAAEAERHALEQRRREEQEKERQARQEAEHREYLEQVRTEYGTGQEELALWPQILAAVKQSTSQAIYQTYFTRAQLLRLREGSATIGVANQAAKEWIEFRLREKIVNAFQTHGHHVQALEFVVLKSRNDG